MLVFKDRSFCASKNCKNKCGRMMTDKEKDESKKSPWPISFGNFCDENGEVPHNSSVRVKMEDSEK